MTDWADEEYQRLCKEWPCAGCCTSGAANVIAALRAAEKRGELKGRIAGLREAKDWVKATPVQAYKGNCSPDEIEMFGMTVQGTLRAVEETIEIRIRARADELEKQK